MANGMNSRERLLIALQHREPDRVPIDLGGTDVSSICRGAYLDLMRYLGRDAEPVVIVNMVEQLPVLDEAFLDEVIRCDTRQIRERPGSAWELKIEDTGRHLHFINEWQIGLCMPKEEGHYFDMVDHPLKEPTSEALRGFPWPDPSDPARWAGLAQDTRHLFETTDYGLVTGCVFGGGVFQFPHYLRGMQDFLADLLVHPEFADELMMNMTEILIEAYEHLLAEVGPYVQVVRICDDIAIQQGPMISPEMYRKRIKPLHKRLVECIRSRTDAFIMFHSDGAMREFLPDLIEIGIDIINPVQVSAQGMEDTAELKRQFGKDLTFWGGICDSQRVLPFGTPEEVREEIRRRLDDLMPGGGFVAAPIHNIQDSVPPENIMMMFETIHEHGIY
jgi:uroporphyrinogen decarboxylase